MSEVTSRLNAALEGRYRIREEIGRGGMATVYLADDLRHSRQVALKVLDPELAAIIGADRFLAEIRTTAGLQHPHILPLFDSGEADGRLFYVMPYVEGESLRDLLDREHQVPVEDAVRSTRKLAEALDYAHRHGVIHRDVKPGNVLFHDGEPVIADFGIALAVESVEGHRLTETGLSLGTPLYMSPEQATGDQHVGPASDIHALGCVLYEMLVGEPPFKGSTPQAILGRILGGEAPSAKGERPSVPEHVDAAIRKALEKLPADRFTRADAFAKALADPGFRHGAGSDSGLGASVRNNLVWTTIAGAVAVAAVVAATVVRPQDPPPIAASITLLGDVFMSPLWPPLLDVSPDGRMVAYPGTNREGETHGYLRPLDGFEASVLPRSIGLRSIFFSPDGEWVAYGTGTELRKAPVGGGPSVAVCTSCGEVTQGIWTAEDRIIFTFDWRELFEVPASGGEPVPLTTLDASDGMINHVWPEALPNGDLLYGVTRLTGNQELRLLSNGESRTVLPETSHARYSNGMLFYSVGSSLFAVDFDPTEGTTSGEAEEVVNDLRLFNGEPKFAVADDGALFYVPESLSSSRRELMRVGRDGEATLVSRGREFARPRLSPVDSTVLLFADEGSLWVLDVASGIERLLTVGTGHYGQIWASGDRILFSTVPSGGNTFIKSADERDDSEQLLTSDEVQWPAAVTPDGGTLVFSQRSPTTGGDIWMVSIPETDQPVLLLGDEYTTWPGGVSPDGRWLVYTSNESGGFEVYVTDLPELDSRWRVSTDGGTEPVWSPRGGELFFRDGDRMMVVSYGTDTDGRFAPEPARALFEGRFLHCCPGLAEYTVAADGQSFFMLQGGEAREIRVWRGWEQRAATTGNR